MVSYKRYKKNSRKRNYKKKGGVFTASEYVQAVTGSAGQQVQLPPIGGNTTNALAFNAELAGSMRGGRKNKRKGGTFGEIALPATLLITNELFKNRRATSKNTSSSNLFNKSRKNRK